MISEAFVACCKALNPSVELAVNKTLAEISPKWLIVAGSDKGVSSTQTLRENGRFSIQKKGESEPQG